MPSKQQDVAKSNISPVLFMSVDGEPMSFFLRPGPVKRELQPLITAGGGMLCKVQQPGAILLIDPEERSSMTEATAHWYVSTKYIHDCIEKDEQLNLEDYRLNPEAAQKQSPRPNREASGRVAYTSEEDAAILSYVGKHKAEVGGNRLWQEMEKQRVTCHPWQSMKSRYKAQLSKKESEIAEEDTAEEDTAEVDAEAAEGETKVEEDQETDVEKPSSAEDAAPPPPTTTSAESDLTQIDSQSVLAESAKPEIAEAQTLISVDGEEVQHVSPQQDEQPAESPPAETVKAETSNSPQLEGACLDSQTDFHLYLTESMEPEALEPQKTISTPKESVPQDSPAAHTESLHNASSKKKLKEKQKASPEPELPLRRITRRQLQLEESPGPEPYGKKLRSSSSVSSSPKPLRKTKPAVKSAPPKDTTDQPPPKRVRGKSAAAEPEVLQEESGPAAVCESTQAAETGCSPTPPRGEKKKEKRELGILMAATKEFEDSSESDGDEAPDLQDQTEKQSTQPTSTDPSSDTAADAASTESDPEPGPSLQEVAPENRASTSDCLPETVDPQPAAAEPAAARAVEETCKPHLFIFDHESQEEDSQSLVGDDTESPSSPQPTGSKDAAFSLTQVQLEEDKQRITELMSQTNQDLVSVTKALLKTSGDFSAALDLLLNPGCISGPFWDRRDDTLLLSANPVVRQQLQEKYGEEYLAKRVVFLEVEG
uniref:telomeric repeat-binding factor 2-interacting protein 1 n=1 Tax=Semicossyphus pulcher TaxID=241346 RepID=UPI0037E9267A